MSTNNIQIRHCADERVCISGSDASRLYIESLEKLLQENGFQTATNTTSWANVAVRVHTSPLVRLIHQYRIGSYTNPKAANLMEANLREHTNLYTIIGQDAGAVERTVDLLRDFTKRLDYNITSFPEKITD